MMASNLVNICLWGSFSTAIPVRRLWNAARRGGRTNHRRVVAHYHAAMPVAT
jgi:hypothetical protein